MPITLHDTINNCLLTRKWLADSVSSLLKSEPHMSEERFASGVIAQMQNHREIHPEGWYSPPPAGVAALFSQSHNFDRLEFDTLRKEEYWPRADRRLESDSAGLIYASPIHRSSGAIGDFGMTIYKGHDLRVQSHLTKCLSVLEQAADSAEVGMEFKELHESAQRLFEQSQLHNARTISWTDKLGTNLGHTIPWSYETPSAQEWKVISFGTLSALRDIISSERIYINRSERFKIPETIAFTLEARLESATDPTMPNIFFHLLITFQSGIRKIYSDFNEVFAALGMDRYIQSKF